MRRAVLLAAGVMSVAIALTGCSGTSVPAATPATSTTTPTYPLDVAARLQSAVLSVSSSAAGNDPTAALTRLDELTTTLSDARARGEVTSARFDSISAAIALVRADLEAVIAAQNAKPGKSDKPGKGDGGNGKND
ncbi:MAG: hypothetical protein V4531_09270 [Actinomycetota bacterium]